MIPAQAVEAAYNSIIGGNEVTGPDIALDFLSREQVTALLEAAAPHMLAEAFEQGQKSGLRHADRLIAAATIGRPELPGPISPNPYRLTK